METDKIVKHECNDAHSRLSKLSESHFQPKDKMQGFFLDRRNSISNRAGLYVLETKQEKSSHE